jgi:hypothetical protein
MSGSGRKFGGSRARNSGYTLSMNHYHHHQFGEASGGRFASTLTMMLLFGFLFFSAQFIIVSRLNPDAMVNPKHHKSKYTAMNNLDSGGRQFLMEKHRKDHEDQVKDQRKKEEALHVEPRAVGPISNKEESVDEVREVENYIEGRGRESQEPSENDHDATQVEPRDHKNSDAAVDFAQPGVHGDSLGEVGGDSQVTAPSRVNDREVESAIDPAQFERIAENQDSDSDPKTGSLEGNTGQLLNEPNESGSQVEDSNIASNLDKDESKIQPDDSKLDSESLVIPTDLNPDAGESNVIPDESRQDDSERISADLNLELEDSNSADVQLNAETAELLSGQYVLVPKQVDSEPGPIIENTLPETAVNEESDGLGQVIIKDSAIEETENSPLGSNQAAQEDGKVHADIHDDGIDTKKHRVETKVHSADEM